MTQTTAVVGAGHAGLAMSRRLTDRSIDHIVLERGEVANSWRTQRWPGGQNRAVGDRLPARPLLA